MSNIRPRKLSTDSRKVYQWRRIAKLLIDEGVYISALLKLRSYWTEFTIKLFAIAKNLKRSDKEGEIRNLRSNAYHIVKIW